MGAIPALLTGLVLAALLGVGCDRNIEPFVEGEKPRQPDLARIFPGTRSDESSTRSATRSAAPSAAERLSPAAERAQGRNTGAGVDAASHGIRGTIAVAPELASSLPASGSLFVIARPYGVPGGPPLAVLRVTRPRFPVSFEIGPENVMIPGVRFEGEIQISVRLDSDGDAMTQLPGDLSGAASTPSTPGADGVDILLDTQI